MTRLDSNIWIFHITAKYPLKILNSVFSSILFINNLPLEFQNPNFPVFSSIFPPTKRKTEHNQNPQPQLSKPKRKELKPRKPTYPKEKRISLAQILVTHMILDLHLGMGLCLSFQPCRATFVARNPTSKHTPKSTSLAAAIGKQTTIFTHSYNPSILGDPLRNGSTVAGPGTSSPLDPRNSNGFLLFS